MLVEYEWPVVLAGVGNGCWAETDVAGWEPDESMDAEAGGVLAGEAAGAVAVMAERPSRCGFIEEQGGEVGVRG